MTVSPSLLLARVRLPGTDQSEAAECFVDGLEGTEDSDDFDGVDVTEWLRTGGMFS